MASPHTNVDAEKTDTTEKANPYDHPNYKGPTKEEDEAVGWEPEPYREAPLEWGPGPVFDPDDIPMPPHDYYRPRWMNADNPEFLQQKQDLQDRKEALAAQNIYEDEWDENAIWNRRRG